MRRIHNSLVLYFFTPLFPQDFVVQIIVYYILQNCLFSSSKCIIYSIPQNKFLLSILFLKTNSCCPFYSSKFVVYYILQILVFTNNWFKLVYSKIGPFYSILLLCKNTQRSGYVYVYLCVRVSVSQFESTNRCCPIPSVMCIYIYIYISCISHIYMYIYIYIQIVAVPFQQYTILIMCGMTHVRV